jgi:hypothetical protein
MSAENQQERLLDEAKKWFVAGLIEGEGSFCIGVKKHPTAPYGYFIDPMFFFYQHKSKRAMVEMVKETLGNVGKIKPKPGNEDVLVLQISSRRTIVEKLIPFFDKYLLFSVRKNDYALFKKATLMLLDGKHHTQKGLIELVDLAYKSCQEGKYRRNPKADIINRILRGRTSESD